MMTQETLRWLLWLVSAQHVTIGAPDAAEQFALASKALSELQSELAGRDSDSGVI
jgi:hypothetical protein